MDLTIEDTRKAYEAYHEKVRVRDEHNRKALMLIAQDLCKDVIPRIMLHNAEGGLCNITRECILKELCRDVYHDIIQNLITVHQFDDILRFVTDNGPLRIIVNHAINIMHERGFPLKKYPDSDLDTLSLR